MPVSKIIKTSFTSPPKFTSIEVQPDPWISSNKNILRVDLQFDDQVDEDLDDSGDHPRHMQLFEDIESQEFREERDGLTKEQLNHPPLLLSPEEYWGDADLMTRNEMLARRLRKIVGQDRMLPKSQRIDAIKMGPEPLPLLLKALDGISPRHIEFTAGFSEEIDAAAIENLFYPWDEVESATITSECMGWTTNTFCNAKGSTPPLSEPAYPEFISRVKTLTLDYCHQFTFRAKNVPVKMTSFRIIGNDAMQAFCEAFDNIPGFSDRLERLSITSNQSDCEIGEPYEFREKLRRCTAICDLHLVLGDKVAILPDDMVPEESPLSAIPDTVYDIPLDDDVPSEEIEELSGDESDEDAAEKRMRQNHPDRPKDSYWDYFFDIKQHPQNNDTRLSFFIPRSVETLSFHCSTSDAMLKDLEYWIDAARDVEWLPKLKQITIRPDGPGNYQRKGEEDKRTIDNRQLHEIQTKIDKIYRSLRARCPPVAIVY